MIRLWCVRLQLLIQKHLSQEKPIAKVTADDVTVLPLPANARTRCQVLLHDRCRINEYFHASTVLLTGPARQLFEPRFQDVMVIPSRLRINADSPPVMWLLLIERIGLRPVTHSDDDNRPRLWPKSLRVSPPVRMGFEPAHITLHSSIKKRRKPILRRLGGHCRRKTNGVEAECQGFIANYGL